MSKNEVFGDFLENAWNFLAEISYLDSSQHYLQLFYWHQARKISSSPILRPFLDLTAVNIDFSQKFFKLQASNFPEIYLLGNIIYNFSIDTMFGKSRFLDLTAVNMIKKIKNAPRSAGWAKRVFDFFSRIFTRCLKKSKKQKLKKNSSFRRCLKKSLWNHFKKSETFTNRSGLKNQYQRWVSCTLFVGRMTISLKNTEFFKRNTIFQGADFSKFSKISIFGLLTIVSYTPFCKDFHCGNEELFRRSKWWFMTKLHFL